MPQRILRDWTESEKIDGISFHAEVLFIRLIMKADDYGSFHANPKLIKANCFPLKDIRESDITRFLNELKDAGLIALYNAENKSFLNIIDFGQRLRTMKRKFPEMSATCGQMSATCQQPAVECTPEVEEEVEEEYEEEEELEGAARPASFDKKETISINQLESKEGEGGKEKSSAKKEKKSISTESAEIISYLNEVCGTQYQLIPSNAEQINGRFLDGYTSEQMRKVIELKAFRWKNDAEMFQNLNPTTLFRKKNLPRYIEEVKQLENNPQLMNHARKQFTGENQGGRKQTHASATDIINASNDLFST